MKVLENGSILLHMEDDTMIDPNRSIIPRDVMEKFVERVQKQGGSLVVEYGMPERRPEDTDETLCDRMLTINHSNRCGQLDNMRGEIIDGKYCIVAEFNVDELFADEEKKYREELHGRPSLGLRTFADVHYTGGILTSVVKVMVAWNFMHPERLMTH